MRTLAFLIVSLSSPALLAQVGGGAGPGQANVILCVKIIDYNCPSIDTSTCGNSTSCSFNDASPPVLVCDKIGESRSLDARPGATTEPQPWESGTTKVKESTDAYCFQIRPCPTNCRVVLINGNEVKKCDVATGTWNNTGPVYQVLVDDGDFCHP